MHSVSATYDDAVNKYAWFKFDGPRGREMSQRSHKRMIKNGDVFGVLALRNGSRYTLIFPDMPHIDFPLDKTAANFLIDRSKKLRKQPDIVRRAGRQKTAGAVSVERQLARRQFDAPRFAPRKIAVESVNGVDFGNYQWRIIEQPGFKIKHTKGQETFIQNDVIGLRFLRDFKGGIIVNQDGMYLKVPTEEYDRVVADTNLIPFQDWPVGTLPVDTIKQYRREARLAVRQTAVERAAAARLARRADALAVKLEQKQLRRAEREQSQQENERMAELRRKVRTGEMEAPGAKPVEDLHPVFKAEIRRGVRRLLREERMLDDEELELNEIINDESPEDEEMSNILHTNPFGADSLSIEDSLARMFGKSDDIDDSIDSDDGAFDLSDIDEPEDDEEEPPAKSKVRKKGTKPVAAAPEATEEDVDNPDDPEDDEDNQDDTESEDDEDEADEEDADDIDDADADDADAEDDSDAESEDDADEEADDSDSDAADAVDEADSSDEEDPDVAAADDEAGKTPQQYAEQNSNPVGSKAREAEEGDIIQFNADAKLKRDWVVLRVSTHKASDNIVIYTVFDITNSPDEVRQIRVNRARKQNLFDYCTHVKDMTPKLFNRVFDMAEDYPVNKEPIAS